MQTITAHPDGILTVDAGYQRPGLAAIHLLVRDGEVAIIDSGTNASLPRVLAALSAAKVTPDKVRWLLLTHIHLDHAGGAGSMLCALPNARVLVHERGVRHLADPSRLWQAAVDIYGVEGAFARYGRLVPVDAARIDVAREGMNLPLGDSRLQVLETPGHARHHVCYWDATARALFAGDTFGLSYRELDVRGRASILPTTTAPQFEPEALRQSIQRLIALQPRSLYLTHFGRVTEVARLGADLLRLLDIHVALACAANGDGEVRCAEIRARLEDVMREEASRQRWPLDEPELFELLAEDLDANARGLAYWLDHQADACAVADAGATTSMLPRRFTSVARLYDDAAMQRLQAAHVCVVGLGGVGSWAAEALARSGVGMLTLVDLDHVAESNINRQVQALDATLGQAKVDAMAERIASIHADTRVQRIDDFLTPDNAAALLAASHAELVLDCVDMARAKIAMAVECRAQGRTLIMSGSAGGKRDPRCIAVADLSRTTQDPLLARVRRSLRAEHGFPRDPKRRFGIEAVFSTEPLTRARDQQGGGLACAGYGSAVVMTASVGLFMVGRALEALLAPSA